MLNKNKCLLLILLLLGLFTNLIANNSHLIIKVENMITTDDTFYITKFIESNKDYRNLGPFYEELLDSLAVHKQDLDYFVIFARSGALSLLDKAEELQYSNRAMSEKLKRSSIRILNLAIEKVYEEWIDKENDSSFLLRNALDLMKLSYRISNQLQNDLIDHYYSYITYGEIYIALNDFTSASEYFKGAKDLSSQLETQEYADIADIYIKLAESNSSLINDATIFDYANFINLYHDYKEQFKNYQVYIDSKANPEKALEQEKNEKMNALNVSVEESLKWLKRLTDLNNRIFGEYNFVKFDSGE